MSLQAYLIYKISSKRPSGANTMYDSSMSSQSELIIKLNTKNNLTAIITPTGNQDYKIMNFSSTFASKQRLKLDIENELKFSPLKTMKSGIQSFTISIDHNKVDDKSTTPINKETNTKMQLIHKVFNLKRKQSNKGRIIVINIDVTIIDLIRNSALYKSK